MNQTNVNFNYTLTRRVNQFLVNQTYNNYTLGQSPHNNQFTDDELPILSIVLPVVAVILFCMCCLKALLSKA